MYKKRSETDRQNKNKNFYKNYRKTVKNINHLDILYMKCMELLLYKNNKHDTQS